MRVKRKLFAVFLATLCSMATAASMVTNAKVTVSDPNGDGTIGISDAIYIISYLDGMFEPDDLDALDFDRNGVISIMDSESVQLYISDVWLG